MPSVHVLFLLHDSSYLRNFDDSIRELLRRGHTLTVAYPETRPDKQQKHLERRLFKGEDLDVRLVPRTRGDDWDSLVHLVRWARTHALHLDRLSTRASIVRERVTTRTPDVVRRWLDHPAVRGRPWLTDRICRLLEAAVPAPRSAVRFIRSVNPDVVLISPYVILPALYQIDYAKAAHQLGIPVGVPVFSWDNLTSKGAIQVTPDRLLVWNETQRDEAVSFHGVPPGRIAVTGGMRFAKFFGAVPRESKAAFCAAAGLDPAMPLVTYLGSSRTIAPEEHVFLWRWIAALRGSPDVRLRECGVFVRPHPTNPAIRAHWPDPAPAGVALWDGRGDDVNGVISSVGHSVAVVGINTTAMLEAAALHKPVLTVLDDELREGQVDRIHFGYLTSVAGGLVTVAGSLPDHLQHLTAVLDGDSSFALKSQLFADAFLRPPHPHDSAVSAFVSEVERLAAERPGTTLAERATRRALRPVAFRLARRLNRPAS